MIYTYFNNCLVICNVLCYTVKDAKKQTGRQNG